MEKAKGFWHEFREFTFKGNAIDLAVGIIIGVAFNAVINSLVTDIIMPAIAVIFGKSDFSSITLGPVLVGNFITQVVNFLIIGLSLFVTLKFIFRYKKLPGQTSS